jgi:NhaA family Na+:H+ antiporter
VNYPSKLVLPAVGAIGGMIVPPIIYLAFNYSDPVAVKGWAIPAATDIAFALGVLTLLGSRVPI